VLPVVATRWPVVRFRSTANSRTLAEHRRERFHPTGPNQVWSMDFVADQLADGTKVPFADGRGYLHSGMRDDRIRTEVEGRKCGAGAESHHVVNKHANRALRGKYVGSLFNSATQSV
jgi:transposase InsO family protein